MDPTLPTVLEPEDDDAMAPPGGEIYAFPLSAQQRRLWFVQQLDPQSALYNMPLVMRMHGVLDARALARAWSEIVRRHEILRTTFRLVDGEPRQEVHPPRPVALPLVDLSRLPESTREQAAVSLRRLTRQQPFDMEHGPLLRLGLLRLTERLYELHLVTHHIINDGWSEGVLVRELTALYGAFRRGRPSPLPELEIQYADYALWQNDWLNGEGLETQLAYWRRKLAALPVLELPRDCAVPPKVRGRGALLPFTWPAELTRDLRELARREGVTLFTVLLAGFKLLLGRYAAQTDVAVGTILANRSRKETEDLIGFFVDNLVLRSDLSGPLTFRELIRRVETTVLEAYEHQDVPFDRLVQELNPQRSTGETPLIQVAMVFQNLPASDLHFEEVELERVPTEYSYAFVDLGLTMRDEPEGLVGSLMYSTDLFECATVERLVTHLRRLMEQAVEAPGRDVEELGLLTDDEWRRWVVEWNDTRREWPQFRFVQDLFEEHARARPQAPAVVHGSRSRTYGELNALANRVAHHLLGIGVGPESRVGICLERGAEMVAAVLGVLKAGGAYVPLDPAHPAERRTLILRDAQVGILLTTSELSAQFEDPELRRVCLDDETALGPHGLPDPPRRNTPGDLAYIIYTSGSTGTPKGVMIAHAGVSNMVRASIDVLGTTPRDRFAQLASLTFDASVAEIMTALCAGASVAIITPARLLEGAEAALQDEAVTTIECAPSLVALLSPEALPALHTVVVGGEACPPSAAGPWREHRRLLNAYGPTEITVAATLSPGEVAHSGASLGIGRPLANMRMYVLDETLNPVPTGVPGEICVGGIGVARGYAGRPALTAQKFVPDPFSGERAARLYRSGDRGRFHASGHIEFLGRFDDQVKLRAHRIELGEIESALQQAPGVNQNVVALWTDERGEKRLVAYVVAAPEASLESDALREHLAGRLPEYMLPAAFVVMDKLPRTVTGKLSRRGLPAPHFGNEQAYAPPRDAEEQALAGVWAEVLGLERVGIHDDFFVLGGHSLLATKVIARARAAGLEVSLAALFEARTVARLVERLRADQAAAALVPPPITRRDPQRVVPLSFAQLRLWLVDQLEPGTATYNIPLALRLRGELRVDVVRAALDEIVRRHEALRTTFPQREGRPCQAIASHAPACFAVVDLAHLPAGEAETCARALVAMEMRRPFDLERGPLMRSVLYVLGEREFALCLTLHHIVGDAASAAVLVRELTVLCEAFGEGRPSPLPELALQAPDVAVWEHDWLRGDVLARHVDYWRRRLEGAPHVLDLATDFPRPEQRSFRCQTRAVLIPAEVSRGLETLARRASATEFMSLLALINVWLHHRTGQSDILIGTPISNRGHVETEPLIGFFVNTVVFRTRIDESVSFGTLLETVRANVLEDQAWQALPFEKLVDELGVSRQVSRNPLFQVMFNLIAMAEPDLHLRGLEVADWDEGLSQTEFDLLLGARHVPQGTQLVCNYGSELFRAATIDAALAAVCELARLAVASPDAPLRELLAGLKRFEEQAVIEQKQRQAEEQRQGLKALRRRAAATGPRS